MPLPTGGGGSSPGGSSGSSTLPKKKIEPTANVDEVLSTPATKSPIPKEDLATGLPLTVSAGGTFTKQPTPSDPLLLDQQRANQPIPSDPYLLELQRSRPKYQPVPSDPIIKERIAFQTLNTIVSKGVSPWDVAGIQNNLRALAIAPQVAYLSTNPELTPGNDSLAAQYLANRDTPLDEIYDGEGNLLKTEPIPAGEVSKTQQSAIWLLENEDFINDWQSSYWSHVATSYLQPLEGQQVVGNDEDYANLITADFFDKWDSNLDPEMKNVIIHELMMFPDFDQIMRDSNVQVTTGYAGATGWRGALARGFDGVMQAAQIVVPGNISEDITSANFRTGVSLATRAPEAIRGVVNNPAHQLLFELDQWLENHPLEDVSDKGKFLEHIVMRRSQAVTEVASTESGFGAFAAGTVALPFTVAADAFNEWVFRSGDPDSFYGKQNASFGQNVAIMLGSSPDQDGYLETSAAYDMMLNLSPVDPINFMAAVGVGIKNASRVPRFTARGEIFQKTLTGQRLHNIPIFDQGPTSRFFYAAFSKHADDFVNTRKANRLWAKIAKEPSEAGVMNIAPEYARAEQTIKYMAMADDPDMVREIARAAMQAPEQIGTDAPLWLSYTSEKLKNADEQYRAAIRSHMDSGGGTLADLSSVEDVHLYLDMPFLARQGSDPLRAVAQTDEVITFDQGVLNRLSRNGPRMQNSPVIGDFTIRGGKVTIRRGPKGTYAAFVDGKWAGSIELANTVDPEMAVAEAFQSRGIGNRLLDVLPEEELANMRNSTTMSDSARRLLDNYTPGKAYVSTEQIYRIAPASYDGSQRAALTSIGGRQATTAIEPNDFANFLDEVNLTEDAVKIIDGAPISALSPKAQQLAPDYVRAKGALVGMFRDEVIVEPRANKAIIRGTDAPSTVDPQPIVDARKAYTEAQMAYTDFRSQINPNQWFIADIATPMNKWTRNLRRSLSTNSNKSYMQGLRRTGYRMNNQYPTNIDLSLPYEGGREVRNWIKFLGGTDELANKWEDAFRAGNAGNRYQIVFDAISEAGEAIDNVMLRESLIQFNEKSGNLLYIADRAGVEMGLLPSGKIRPTTVSHLQKHFVMPNAKELAVSLRRYRQARRLPTRLRKGIIDSSELPESIAKRVPSWADTGKTRKDLKQRLAARVEKLGITGVSEDDLLNMAYADILGEGDRAKGFGILSRAARLPAKGAATVHNLFVISQLAGRPIPWMARYGLEEQIRGGIFGLPALWRNPYDYGYQLWDTHGIRKLPELVEQQGRAADRIVTEMFSEGYNLDKIRETIPDFDYLLNRAGLEGASPDRIKAFAAATVSDSLTGVSAGTLGSDLNATMRTARRTNKIEATKARMLQDGLHGEFRFDIDAADISQRSAFSSFMLEAEASTIPSEWSTIGMSVRQQRIHGRNYGRLLFQMQQDPIVGRYGIQRAIASAAGQDTAYTAERLVRSQDWARIRHIVDELVDERGLEIVGETARAQWYLDNIVSEIVDTLFDPLARHDRTEKVRILTELRNGGTTTLEVNGVTHRLSASAGNYEGFVRDMAKLAEDAYAEGMELPPRIAGFVDPRFGMRDPDSTIMDRARKASDWIMLQAGERFSQTAHRQPAFVKLHGQWYRYLKDAGWGDEAARYGATQKATEITNFVFFDNKNIPAFLKDMNRVVPFFSAMFEVASTWIYKIPSVNVLPVGYVHLARRVDRTLDALTASGIATYNKEFNSYEVAVNDSMDHVPSDAMKGLGKALFHMANAPRKLMETVANLAQDAFGEDNPGSNLSAWAKDGYQYSIGNPLDPSSSGIMAVNQFSLGATPAVQIPAGIAAEALFNLTDKRIATQGETVGEFLAANPEYDLAQLIRYNEEAFAKANTVEMLRRAIDGDWDPDTMTMPETIKIPNTSLAETLTDNVFFPFGKMHQNQGALTFWAPSWASYTWRGLFQRMGWDGDEMVEFMLGSQAESMMGSELLGQLQIREAATGDISRVMEMMVKADQIVDTAELQVAEGAEGGRRIINPESDSSASAAVHELWAEADRLTEDIIRESNNAAGGSNLLRSVMGYFSPTTPRMWDREQQQIADYWAARDIATKVQETGTYDFTQVQGIQTVEDMRRLQSLVARFVEDPSGDESRMWLKSNYPSLMMYAQGKSYWAESGIPVYAAGFDDWQEQMSSGEREVFPPEVFMQRYWRSGISVDRDLAIVEEFGNDPVIAAQSILSRPDRYKELTEDYNARYDSMDFIDTHLFESKYAAWKEKGLDELSLYEVLEQRKRVQLEQTEAALESLRFADLPPDEERMLSGVLTGSVINQRQILDELRQFENDNSVFRNRREQLLDDYFNLHATPYYDGMSAIIDERNNAETKADESRVWEKLRDFQDDKYNDAYFLTDELSGRTFEVPAPMIRTWNARPQRERQERILTLVSKKPQWLNQFEVEILAAEHPLATHYLPATQESRERYKIASQKKEAINAEWMANPDGMTKSARDRKFSEVDEELDDWLSANGRELEIEFREAVPMQRLDMLGLVPASLQGAMPVLNTVLQELKFIKKSPTSNAGYTAMQKFDHWMRNEYYPVNPTAETDFLNLSYAMYGTKTHSVAIARMMQGELFGSLG